MAGAWLTSLGRHLTRPDSFEHLVAPAIADLQVESNANWWKRGRHYSAVCVVLAFALLRDVRGDLAPAMESSAIRDVWVRATAWYLGVTTLLVTLSMSRGSPWHLKGAEEWSAALKYVASSLPVGLLSVFVVAAMFYLARRMAARRTVVAMTLVLIAVTTAAAVASSPVRASAKRELQETVERAIHVEQTRAPDNPRARRPSLWLYWTAIQSEDRGRSQESAAIGYLRGALGVVPMALLGISLARRRGWRVALSLAGFFSVWIVLGGLALSVESRWFPMGFRPPPESYQRWRDVAVPMVTALLWLWRDRSLTLRPRTGTLVTREA